MAINSEKELLSKFVQLYQAYQQGEFPKEGLAERMEVLRKCLYSRREDQDTSTSQNVAGRKFGGVRDYGQWPPRVSNCYRSNIIRKCPV